MSLVVLLWGCRDGKGKVIDEVYTPSRISALSI